MNRIELYKREKDGLDILEDIPRYAREGWEAIDEGDRERLKWAGVFFRKHTPGHFMMRIRIPNGVTNAAQLRTIARITEDFGREIIDITTRQQIQVRWFRIEHVPEIWDRLRAVGLVSLQTGMDNIRNVVGCSLAGLTPTELFDASLIVRQFTEMFVGNREFTNLPRKFNVTITGCRENCTHAESQDIALTPATAEIAGKETIGFNVAVGGKMGSGGYRIASPLNVFTPAGEAAEVCRQITLLYRDHGFREARSHARLAFLIDDWGTEKFREALEARMGRPLLPAGQDQRHAESTDHMGVFRQKQEGKNSVGLVVPVGRLTAAQLSLVARLAETYGTGEVRLTVTQNIIVPHVSDTRLGDLTAEPLLQELRYDPPEILRGLVSCVGIDYCNLALVETKGQALQTARELIARLGQVPPITLHWSGCSAGCGNHATADIGLLGTKVKIAGKVVEAYDVYVQGKSGPGARLPRLLLESVPAEKITDVLEPLVRYFARRH